jgi:hypothetical protein
VYPVQRGQSNPNGIPPFDICDIYHYNRDKYNLSFSVENAKLIGGLAFFSQSEVITQAEKYFM